MMQIMIGRSLWGKLVKLIRESTKERAFYLVGIEDATRLVVLEAFEFCYLRQTEYSIMSDPICRILLETTLPINTRIIAIMHSHPFAEEPSLSSVDLALAEEYQDTPIITLTPTGRAIAKVVRGSGEGVSYMEEVDVAVKEDGDIRPIIVGIDKYYGVFTRNQIGIIEYLIPIKYAQFEWRILRASKYERGQILRPRVEWVGIVQTYLIPHMLMGKLKKEQLEYFKRQELIEAILDTY